MTVKDKTLLFIESLDETRREIIEHFAPHNTVMVADCLSRAEECLMLFKYDVIIADADFRDGKPFLLYEKYPDLPPLILYSFQNNDETKIEWLRRGAIDYVIRPASIKLLEAKISLRISEREKIKRAGIVINKRQRSAFYQGTEISLTSSEFNILKFLIENKDTFFSSNEIYEMVWQARALNTVTIRKHISSLRRKLLSATGGRDFILTDFGKGYAYTDEA